MTRRKEAAAERIIEESPEVMDTVLETPAEIVDVSKAILRRRARKLAEEPAAETLAEEALEVAEFIIAGERYALDSSFIREVTPLKHLTPVPCTPAFVAGLMNLRGEVLSVIDLRKFFDLPEQEITSSTRVVILHDEEMEFGILADSVVGMRSLPHSDIQKGLVTLTDMRAKYLYGVTEDRLAIMDAKAILSDQDLVVHDDI